jgi:hypothetical protein
VQLLQRATRDDDFDRQRHHRRGGQRAIVVTGRMATLAGGTSLAGLRMSRKLCCTDEAARAPANRSGAARLTTVREETLLHDAIRRAPRRYRMPALPVEIGEALARGPACALAFAIERARESLRRGVEPDARLRQLFTAALVQSIRRALRPTDGDRAFQALLLRTRAAEVGDYLRLSGTARHDRRDVRAAIDALAHPGKLHSMPRGVVRDALSALHALASRSDWAALPRAIDELLQMKTSAPAHAALKALLGHQGLARLRRHAALARTDAVQQYQALCAQRGHAAIMHGDVAMDRGAATEVRTLRAFQNIAELLSRADRARSNYRAVGGLLVPKAFPGIATSAKGEWDAALVRRSATGDADELRLLAEAKASPEAAAPDLGPMLRGLRRLARAQAGGTHVFPSRCGAVSITGDSLRRLRPCMPRLPPEVIYCCDAPAEVRPPWLGAASRAALLAEPVCLEFARHLVEGNAPCEDDLRPAWIELLNAQRLRPVLHQWDTACTVRDAMLHPDDLVASVAGPACA